MLPELQPVILAAGEGSKMYPLTEEIPKCLLPVGNYPMIWYVITYLEKYGFDDIIIIVRTSAAKKINQALQALFQLKKFDFAVISDDEEDMGTATSLRMIKDKIKTDVLILSCDMLTDAPLYRIMDLYRTYNSCLTTLLVKRQEIAQDTEQQTKGGKNKTKESFIGEKDFVAVDDAESRLLFLTNEADIETDTVVVKKSLLKRFPNLHIRTDLVDSHVYIMKKWLFDYLSKVDLFESIKSDLVPYIIRKQFSKARKIKPSNDIDGTELMVEPGDDDRMPDTKDIFNFVVMDDLSMLIQEWSGYSTNKMDNEIKCHAHISDSFCLRINNLPAYSYVNKQIMKLFPTLAPNTDISNIHSTVSQNGKSQIGPDCLVGESTSINDKVTIKRSVIGKHCSIGSRVKITNSIIMNHVTIKDGCIVQNSIVCDNAYIKENCQIITCRVSVGHTVPENSELKDETIVHEEMDFDE